MKFCILTCSDTCAGSPDANKDKSGTELIKLLEGASSNLATEITGYIVVADEFDKIQESLIGLSPQCDVLLTVGGTGLGKRDVTPEATKSVIQKECNGIATALINRGLQATPMAALTRLTAGMLDNCLIVNLPGSPKAVRESFEVLEPILKHAVALIKGESEEEEVKKVHEEMAKQA